MAGELKSLMIGPPRLTLAAAESVTCGRVQAAIGAASGASEFFLGGITAYTLEQKVRHLGVDAAMAKAANCVSEEIAVQMACGACKLFGSDLALATTGYAEPAPAQGVAAPFAWWALAHASQPGKFKTFAGRVDCAGLDRVAVQKRIASEALAVLLNYVRNLRVR